VALAVAVERWVWVGAWVKALLAIKTLLNQPNRNGEGRIRTHGTVTRTTVFETASDNGVPRLKDRMIKVQTTLVAGPRNH
jgi:hypothetical protein